MNSSKEPKDKRKAVFVSPELHIELQEVKLSFAKQGKDLTFGEIIKAGLDCLNSKQA